MKSPSPRRAGASARPASGCSTRRTASPGTFPTAPGRAGPAGYPARSLPVLRPRHTVHARCRVFFKASNAAQAAAASETWCSNAVNRASLSFRATSRTRTSSFDTPLPALRPGRVSLARVPHRSVSFPPPPPHGSRRLVRRVAGTTGDLTSRAVHPGITALAFPRRPARRPRGRAATGPPGSRARRFRTCHGSLTARGPPAARANAAAVSPSGSGTASAPRTCNFAAQ